MVGTWHRIEREQLAYHVLHLFLVGGARAHHRKLDLARREFPHAEIPLRAGDERRTARLARCERRSDVLPEPYRFDSHARGFEAIDHRADLFVDLAKTQELDLRGRRYATVCDARELGAALRHDSPARVRQAWVNPEYDALARYHCAPLHSQTFVRYCIIPI